MPTPEQLAMWAANAQKYDVQNNAAPVNTVPAQEQQPPVQSPYVESIQKDVVPETGLPTPNPTQSQLVDQQAKGFLDKFSSQSNAPMSYLGEVAKVVEPFMPGTKLMTNLLEQAYNII